jgi:hypothetical protein
VAEPLVASPVKTSPSASAIVPVEIDGLPAEIEAFGRRWQRKVEFHMTVIGAARVEEIAAGDPGVRERVAGLLEGRSIGTIEATRELRHVRHPEDPSFETIIVMVRCPALVDVYDDLSGELGTDLTPLPAHVTLYSTDPEDGIGINDQEQLRERAPALSGRDQEELRRAMRFDEVFGTSPQQ